MKPGRMLLATVLLLSSCTTFHGSQPSEDHWWAEDKAKHFGLSAVTSFGLTWAARDNSVATPAAASAGFTLTLSGGVLKELWDATASDGSGWSWKDLAFDLAGTTVGTWAGTATPTR